MLRAQTLLAVLSTRPLFPPTFFPPFSLVSSSHKVGDGDVVRPFGRGKVREQEASDDLDVGLPEAATPPERVNRFASCADLEDSSSPHLKSPPRLGERFPFHRDVLVQNVRVVRQTLGDEDRLALCLIVSSKSGNGMR